MFDDFFNHKCNIYHLTSFNVDIGYGFEEQNVKHEYLNTPDIEKQRCHFHTKSFSMNMQQSDPLNTLPMTRKISFPIGTDIRINDKVVDCDSGIAYTAQLPVKVQNHHIVVILTRTDSQVIL